MDLVNRLKYFIETQKIGISQFADSCMIPRPTMSQILNGRNKKVSDELITKIHVAYPSLSVLWLMFNEGPMLTNENTRFSEPQNHTKSPDRTMQAGISQPVMPSQTQYIPNQGAEQNRFHNQSGDELQADRAAGGTSDASEMPSQYIDFAFASSENEESAESMNQNVPGTTLAELIDRMETGAPIADSDAASDSIYISHDDMAPHSCCDAAPAASAPAADGRDTQKNMSGKRITNIVVFYSDNSFQSFGPA